MSHIDVITEKELWNKDIDGYLPILLDVYNPDIVWTQQEKDLYGQEDSHIRFISDDIKVIYKGKTYLPCSFEYQQPETDGSKIGNASISISALDTRVRNLLRSIKIKSEAKVVAMFAKVNRDDDSGKFIYKFVELNSKSFCMKIASSSKTTATFNLDFESFSGQNIPYDSATQDRVPATSGKQ